MKLFELDDVSICKGLIMAALLESPDVGMSEDEMGTICDRCSADRIVAMTWELVLDGRIGVSVESGEVTFRDVPEGEREARRGWIALAIRAGADPESRDSLQS